jgi:hypothetical protein
MNQNTGNAFRITAIVFMGMTAAMNILGGIGTVCAAFLTKDYPPLWEILIQDYQLQYQVIMIATIIVGIINVWVLIKLVRGSSTAYRNALIILVIGSLLGGTQFFTSKAVLGKATPANIKFYTNLVTLLIFALISLPGIRAFVDFSKPSSKTDNAASGGLAAIVAGGTMLSIYWIVGSSHIYMGDNWVDVLQAPLIIGGLILTLSGLGSVAWAVFESSRESATGIVHQPKI